MNWEALGAIVELIAHGSEFLLYVDEEIARHSKESHG